MKVSARIVALRLSETFVISRESQDEAEVVQVEIEHGGVSGFGEGAPIGRYSESAQSVGEHHTSATGHKTVIERLDA